MLVSDYGKALGRALHGVTLSPPEGTALHKVAREAREMAAAYLADGETFLAAGDLMNGLAAFAYGSGWLDAASTLGLFTPEALLGFPPFPEEAGLLAVGRVREKRERYRRMLSGAVEAIECAPDPGTPLFAAATLVLGRAEDLLGEGDRHAAEGRDGDALACYSHGHGWLDAGVRAGLFRILHSRELFTVAPF